MLSYGSKSAMGSVLFLTGIATSTGFLSRFMGATTSSTRNPTSSCCTSMADDSKAKVTDLSPNSVEDRVAYWETRGEELQFLEEVEGDAALEFVNNQNRLTADAFGDPTMDPLYEKVLSILDSKEKIPHVRKIGEYYYNFWQDSVNPRGVWRRTSLKSYRNMSTEWELVLDVDALGREEGQSWVWGGATAHHPDDLNELPTRALLLLSQGGSDAKTMREFDLVSKRFVSLEEGGFQLTEPAKCRFSWLNRDTLLAGTNVDGIMEGVSDSLTDSGYPRLILEWTRGTRLSAARVAFEGEKGDVSISGYVSKHRGHSVEWRHRAMTFYTAKHWVRFINETAWHELPLQDDAEVGTFRDQVIITLRSAWSVNKQEYAAGTVLAANLRALTRTKKCSFQVLFQPAPRLALDSYIATANYLVVHTLEDVKSRLTFWKYLIDDVGAGAWELVGSETSAVIRGISLSADDDDRNDLIWMTMASFLTPSSLFLLDASEGPSGVALAVQTPVKSLPPQFDSTGLEESQGHATSVDGEIIPYFMIRKKDAPRKEKTPCLLYGYGGFEISILPYYLGSFGPAWLEEGNTYVLANIRGGGEFGPDWHKAALKEKRHKAYEDFIAVAEDLVNRGVVTSQHLAARGGSNGGLLMGNMFTLRPDLFKAVVCAVPLLDMRRFSVLLAGASWMAEYGDPNTSDWDAFLKKHSSLHQLDPTGKTDYPKLLLTTSMKDDRVHPYHARAFCKRLGEIGAQDVFYYENVEGGHAGAADSKQQAYVTVLYIKFLKKYLS